ncbi:hypothetical protein [Nitrosomonas sp. Is37]|uniref:hypothetical protein n=1 Tax=Nitrosomonas sp. Is37 TaxID=3080535 RepID=UPI00294B48C6|nr:hypothetical protein [Nitrosomonas sp. Is37]MDV6345517.1 hypothetical protein [Nitrosomonas sp. Is37]
MPRIYLALTHVILEETSFYIESPFYIESHRQRFIKEMLDGPDADVLPHYVSLLETQGQMSLVGKDKD